MMDQHYSTTMPPSASHEAELDALGRSTRGASKYRRDQINLEIQRLRDLLPLNSCVKDRLFQLQVMSLAVNTIRKERYLPHVIQTCEKPIYPPAFSTLTPKEFDVYKAIRGFMLVMTQEAKILHISENASEYLGYSVEEIMCQGDSILDIIDQRDHSLLQQQLDSALCSVFDSSFPRECAFVYRMNLSKTAKRQLNSYRFVMLEGRYIHALEYYKTLNAVADPQSRISPIFAALCTPLICPKNAEALARGSTQIFQARHSMDMRFVHADQIALEYLGFTLGVLTSSLSWYDLVHPEQLRTLAEAHRTLCREREGSVMCLFRVRNKYDQWIWLHSVLTVKQTDQRAAEIQGVYQCFDDMQAESLLASPWIYSTKHYVGYRGDSQKDVVDSPESIPSFHHHGSMDSTRGAPTDVKYAFDANNNCDANNNNNSDEKSLDSYSILSAVSKSICLEQLQQFYASEFFGSTLPELGRYELEDTKPQKIELICQHQFRMKTRPKSHSNSHFVSSFFRQVEQQTSSSSSSSSSKSPERACLKREASEEPTAKAPKREHDPYESADLWTQQWTDQPTEKLPPVSSLALFHSDAGTPNPPPPMMKAFSHDAESEIPTNCFYQHLAHPHTQKRLGSWAGIQTG